MKALVKGKILSERESGAEGDVESEDEALFPKDGSATDDYEMRNNVDDTGVDDHPAVADDHGHDDPIESEVETDVREGEVKGEEAVINMKETEDVVKVLATNTEMTKMSDENEKKTDADATVIDGVGKPVTENEKIKEIKTVGTAGNADVVTIPGDEHDGSNDAESEDDEKKTRDFEEDVEYTGQDDGEDTGQDDGSSTDGTFAGFSGFSERSKSQSGSGSETDRYMYTISGTETCN